MKKQLSLIFIVLLSFNVSNGSTKQKKSIDTTLLIELYVECLFVADSTVYEHFSSISPNLNDTELYSQMRIFFVQMASQVNQKLQNSFSTDPNLRIYFKMADILIFKNPNDTIWTMNDVVGVSGIPVFSDRETVTENSALNEFKSFLNNLSLPYDFAVGFTRKDIWGSNGNSTRTRSIISGITTSGSMCSNSSFSIIEFNGFESVFTVAQQLARSIGVPYDGTSNLTSCQRTDNYLMTPFIGVYDTNLQNLHEYSSCSVSSFISQLISSNNVTSLGKCLLNRPPSNRFMAYYESLSPGQLFNVDDQCKYIHGPNWTFCESHFGDVCTELSCKKSNQNECQSLKGLSAVDGTRCDNGKICRNGVCVNQQGLVIRSPTNCTNVRCLNNGTCLNVNNFFLCTCSASQIKGSICAFDLRPLVNISSINVLNNSSSINIIRIVAIPFTILIISAIIITILKILKKKRRTVRIDYLNLSEMRLDNANNEY